MHTAKLVWATPDGDDLIAYMARVSNPENQDNTETAPRLIRYLWRHHHLSPFEMVSMCCEIETTRDISRQILRHRSFSFQEFSQRYAEVPDEPVFREARSPHPTNRQHSHPITDPFKRGMFEVTQHKVWEIAYQSYESAIRAGVAKEQARALLPEGMTPTRLYMTGTLRSWLHFWMLRRGNGTQREASRVADSVGTLIEINFPMTFAAVEEVANG